jgi:hypothetical protein
MLRQRALEVLGPLGDALARDVIEVAEIDVLPGVASWEGSHGRVRADRIVLTIPPDLLEAVSRRPAARHALEAAFAAAVAEEPHTSLYELVLEQGTDERGPERGKAGPYR